MNALEIHDLSKSYPGFMLDNLTFSLPCGCIMGLIGENGAGKSTTIKLILNMIESDAGTVSILGRDNRDNIRLTKEDIGVVLDEVGISECLTAKQVGNLLILDEATSGLDPVVRDEVIDMLEEFTRNEENAILISSHIVSDLEKICDYIAFLHNGKLLLCEEKNLLMEQYGIIHCTEKQLANIKPSAVKGKKESAYGEAIVARDAIPSGITVRPVDIEQLFIFMVKERK